MKLRLLWFDHIPPGISLTHAQRLHIWALSRKIRNENPESRRATSRTTLISIGIAELIVVAASVLLPSSVVNGQDRIVLNLAGLLICTMIYLFERRRTHAPFVWRALCEIGKSVCWECGYPFEGLNDSANCPECGCNRADRTSDE